MALDIRPWRPGEETEILKLFQASFGRPMAEDFWRWRYLDHPAGDPLVILAWDGDRLAAHYAASHAPLQIDGESVPAALSMTTMTDPDYRGQGLMEKTGSALYDVMAASGIKAVWGFPNVFSNVTFQRKLGWTSVGDIANLSLTLDDRPAPETTDVVEVPEIDGRFGQLAARVAASVQVCGARGEAILRWRVDRNPVNRYTRLILPDGEEIAAYAILKSYGDDAFDLVDFCADGADAARGMILAVVGVARAHGRTRVNAWCLNRDANRLVLERAGFVAGGPVTYFGAREFGDPGRDLTDPRLWRLSMLDSDLY
ncbi:hypothetical protein DEA8626_00403 [Defluviimonas aquaemixtae]|uniref:N-acetyltransferase domain-containing protein n=1 Tax=Albidovulum aquaemixtae TaxID=1542388 RepID=A0A2R8B2N5_9RHOB|nr:GNAT family N-acetyltransferase [Defluviimonas aquaemixtae]SPH16889.1 hypothetical protein DEA8626_00403 [Defluviimonas aquaemixtae]